MDYTQRIFKPTLVLYAFFLINCANSELSAMEPENMMSRFDLDQAVYVTMPDGVQLAVDFYLPQHVQAGKTVPTMLQATRYWRSQETVPPQTEKNPVVQEFINRGYAVVLLDVRGTGASFGTRATEFSVAETKDLTHVVDWITNQPWSNGAVGAIGYSYAGNTSENMSLGKSAGLKAIVPLFTDFDLFTSIVMPGGLKNNTIIVDWGKGTAALDRNEVSDEAAAKNIVGVKPVDEDTDRVLLVNAVKDHEKNRNIRQVFADVIYRDDVNFAQGMNDSGSSMVSPGNFRKAATENAVPAFHMGSWMDASTAAGVLARFIAGDTPSLFVIGAWNHGASLDANPYLPADTPVKPALEEQYIPIFEFLERSMSGNGVPTEAELYYFTMGENVWRKTRTWPPKGSVNKRYYLADGHQLLDDAPRHSSGATQYKVNFEHGTGKTSRWTTQLGDGVVDYGDRSVADESLLIFTSAPLEHDLEITGFPVIHLSMSSTTMDGAVIAYLEDVDPDGTVRLLTEGHLRLIHRKVSGDTPPYPVVGPYHSFLRKDSMDMPPGKVEQVSFTLLPTSTLIKKGHRLRIAIAGHDKDSFERVPSEGNPVYRIEHNSVALSFLDLPVITREIDDGVENYLSLFNEKVKP